MTSVQDEYDRVELPFIQQLHGLGWDYLGGDTDIPYLTDRESFRQVLLTGRLRKAIARVNLDEKGEPWLDESQVKQMVSRLERLGKPKLIEANQVATNLLLHGTQVEGPDGKNVTAYYLDLERPERNDFLAINQFRVDPPWATGGTGYIIPDLVLFVNGIPLIVVEGKRPDLEAPLVEAVDQLLRYSNQRDGVSEPEGAERLFHYVQLMVATCFDTARLGAVAASFEHYLEWKDTYPISLELAAQELGVEQLSGQQMMISGVLRPEHLLDILRNFTVFKGVSGRTIKVVPRYQQYRAVHKAIKRLTEGETRLQHGDADQRGGIIWHTQGSGKSLTMIFLVRKMRTLPELRRFKVVAVTDRVDLERQLAETATLTGEPLQRSESVAEFQEFLSRPGSALVFGMIQKAQHRDLVSAEEEVPPFPLLNDSEEILLLVDEAHRSHTRALHANLMAALPNCAKIGFTGTPIIQKHKKRTHEIFGPFIDVYSIKQSQDDGATVPIRYEGRTATGTVANGETLDQLFEDMFRERTRKELEAIQQKYATTGNVLEAQRLIRAKARDMLRHYVGHALPGGYKAQVVAVSRRAAVRYQRALVAARRELVAELEKLSAGRGEPDDFLRNARPHLERIRRLKFAAVISGGTNDPSSWKEWTHKGKQEGVIADFKKPFDDAKDEGRAAVLIVKSMLLTGFDAPVEQVLYVDRAMRDHELLQAIARVNRTFRDKSHGLVVDYFGVAHHLQEALEAYAEGDIDGALFPIRDLLPKLDDQHRRVVSLFTSRGRDLDEVDACVELLHDGRLRATFGHHLKGFLQTLDAVLPRPEALPYIPDARRLGLIHAMAVKRTRDEGLQLIVKGAEAKVRQLIDEHVRTQGIDVKVPPIDILATDFDQHVAGVGSLRAQAAEMQFATRHHIRRHYQEDPVYYRKLSERLEKILQAFADNWEALVKALRDLIGEYRAAYAEQSREDRSLLPFLRLLSDAVPEEKRSQTIPERLAAATVQMVELVRGEIGRVDFWRNPVAQGQLRSRLVLYLDDHDLVPFEQQEALADQVVQTARANHTRLVQ